MATTHIRFRFSLKVFVVLTCSCGVAIGIIGRLRHGFIVRADSTADVIFRGNHGITFPYANDFDERKFRSLVIAYLPDEIDYSEDDIGISVVTPPDSGKLLYVTLSRFCCYRLVGYRMCYDFQDDDARYRNKLIQQAVSSAVQETGANGTNKTNPGGVS